MTLHDTQVIALQEWWLGELKRITAKVIEKEERRQASVKAKNFKDLDGYRGVGDILDAYGMGCITSRKKDHLMDLIEKRELMEGEDPMYQLKLNMLHELGETARQILAEYRQVIQ